MKIKVVLVTMLLAAGAVVYYLFNPAKSSLFPKCPFFVATGLKCPGCGSQRAIHSLLHLDFRSAIGYNALLVFSLPIVALLTYAEINRKRKPSFYTHLNNQIFIWGCFTVVTAWWILRNVFNL